MQGIQAQYLSLSKIKTLTVPLYIRSVLSSSVPEMYDFFTNLESPVLIMNLWITNFAEKNSQECK
jgi:hypothetical protein